MSTNVLMSPRCSENPTADPASDCHNAYQMLVSMRYTMNWGVHLTKSKNIMV